VNISEHQLLDAGFPARVAETLDWAQLPAHQLCLEISEDVVTEHLTGSIPVLERIAEQGVRLSLDDFGTGRTTMAHVKRLNDVVHQVKIDRAFITDLPVDPIDQAVVEAVSRIASAAGFTVVAEGVETTRQAQKLLSLGIEHHQGFLYSHGVAAERLTKVFLDTDHPTRGPLRGLPPARVA
jgi:EAL domain-containing protein (putative c-di-GMP-specific phosphodiesterase class I)